MSKGLNKAKLTENIEWLVRSYDSPSFKSRPCVFLSHKKEDKNECRKVAEYLKQAEIDYYLDELDDELQLAARDKNPIKITESIKKGIRNSSHMLVVVSEKKYNSQMGTF